MRLIVLFLFLTIVSVVAIEHVSGTNFGMKTSPPKKQRMRMELSANGVMVSIPENSR